MGKEVVKYNGEKYHRGPDGYYRKNSDGYGGYLHREIWKNEKGEIPEDKQIHHVDGDKSNNDIENLKLVSASKHREIHGATNEDMPEEAREAAKEWHKSDEGREWHSEMAEEAWKDKERL